MPTENHQLITDWNGFQTHEYWAAEFEVDPETLKTWIHHYKIPHRRMKSKWLIRAGDLFEYAEKVYEREERQ